MCKTQRSQKYCSGLLLGKGREIFQCFAILIHLSVLDRIEEDHQALKIIKPEISIQANAFITMPVHFRNLSTFVF